MGLSDIQGTIMSKIVEATSTPDVIPNDPALMTQDEYLLHRNPDKTHHEDNVYDTDISQLNFIGVRPVSRGTMQSLGHQSVIMHSNGKKTLHTLSLTESGNRHGGDIVAVYFQNTWHYDSTRINEDTIDGFGIDGSMQVEKYTERFLRHALEELAGIRNKEEYGKPIKRIKLTGEYFSIHVHDGNMAVMDNHGLIVALASNEWGATLIQVSKEYRGKGIGTILGKLFIEQFNLTSGGYTDSGVKNAKRIWNDRVSEYVRNGWYTELIKNNDITKSTVKDILKDFKTGTQAPQEKIPKKVVHNTKIDYLVYMDEQQSNFILYDSRFLEDQDDAYIHGMALLMDTDHDKEIIYKFEYDDDRSRKTLSYVLLQAQRDHNTGVNVKFAGSDLFEYSDLKDVEEEDGMVYLTKDKVSIQKLHSLETRIRERVDQYDEIKSLLLEMAESKY